LHDSLPSPSEAPSPTEVEVPPLVKEPSVLRASDAYRNEETPALRRNLAASVIDAGTYSVMVGIAETYFGPFALALGLSADDAGLMVTVPVLIGAVVQLITPWAVRWAGTHRGWIVGTVFAQVACLLMLLCASWFNTSFAVAITFVALCSYWAMGLAGGPAWNTWMEEIVPSRIRTRYFACRQRLSQVCLMFSFALGGLALQWGQTNGQVLNVFVGLFLVAAIARTISGLALASQTEPSRGNLQEEIVGISRFFHSEKQQSGGWLVMYLLAVQVGVQLSGPYFAPFMLKQEGMSYFTFMVLVSLGILGKAISLPYWGRIGHRYGPRRLLTIGGLAIVPLSAFWILADFMPNCDISFLTQALGYAEPCIIPGQVICIGIIQPVSGCAWAAYELAMSLMFLHGISRQQRTSMLTWYNFGNSAAMVIGSLLGAALIRSFGEFHSTYLLIFWASSFVRLLTIVLLLRVK
jgi:MFS family permease